MSLRTKIKNLLIPHKSQREVAQPGYETDQRAIEVWAAQVLAYLQNNGIIEIVAGANVTVTNGFGPVTTISASGGGAGYPSLTGQGAVTTPGDLAQAGGLTVTAPSASLEGFQVTNNSTHQGIYLTNGGANAGIQVTDSSSSNISILEEGATLSITCYNGAGTIQNCSVVMGPITPTSLSDLRLRTPSHASDAAKTNAAGMEIELGSNSPIRLYTGFSGTGGQPTYTDSERAFSFGSDGHIYTSTGSGWSLVA